MAKLIPYVEDYFEKLTPPRNSVLAELEQQAEKENIPIIGPVVGELLYILAVSTFAQRILELGTATGYSTIFLAQACQTNNGHVITIEYDQVLARQAQRNLERLQLHSRVDVRIGDAFEVLSSFQDPFDLIFMDIEKKDYVTALPHCERLLQPGKLLVVDNVAFNDAVSFNENIYNNNRWRSVHLLSHLPGHSPEKDGLCLAVRTRN